MSTASSPTVVVEPFDPCPEALVELVAKLTPYLPEAQIASVRDAYYMGARAHHGQTRKSGEPYITHPLAVSGILAELGMDVETLCAAILHDALEDTELARDQIAGRFGEAVAELVDGVTKLDKISFRDRHEAAAESFRKMMLAMARDLRVILIKLADRLHNMRTMVPWPAKRYPHRPRDPRHLRAHRAPSGPEPDQPRAAGSGFQGDAPLAACRD
jgi:guanosine-3',5'-bis(diphosphate) 3'-pyrophosphohydrolase